MPSTVRADAATRRLRFAAALAGFTALAGVISPSLQAQELDLRARARTAVQIAELGPFLQGNLMIGETEKNLTLALRLDLVARDGTRVSSWRSDPVEMAPGRRYPTRRWIPDPKAVSDELAVAPLKPAEFVIFRIGQKTVVEPDFRGIPGECRDNSHVLMVSLVGPGRLVGPSGTGKTMAVCLDVG